MKAITLNFLGTFLVILALASFQKALANASQPGIWGAGGKVYTMLYPEDSLAFKKVQMQQERIFIQLYKGYAVVKAWYQFKNTTSEQLRFKMGYPVNGIYNGGEVDLNQVHLDSLGSFKIFAEQKPLEIVRQPITDANGEINYNQNERVSTFSENWYVWQMDFAPNQTQEVVVYFIVETNNAGVTRGYERENYNAFIYLLESGSVWKNPIERGDFYMQLQDGLTANKVQGMSQNFGFKFNDNQTCFWGQKLNFTPTPTDNLVVTYAEKMETFNFNSVLLKSETLYQNIDKFSQLDFQNLSFSNYNAKSPYEVETTFWGAFPFILTILVIVLPVLIGLVVAVIIVVLVVRFIKRKKIKNQ